MTASPSGTRFDEWQREDWRAPTEGGPVRFAVVGLGSFAREYALPAFARASDCEATVAVSSSPAKAESVAGEFDMARAITYDEYHDGVAAEDYDAVYVVTPHALHEPYVETAARLDKAVLCEKAMAATREGAERIAETVAEAGIPFMVAYRMQFGPAVRRARDLVESGFVGDPVHVHGSFTFRLLDDPDAESDRWRVDKGLSGGGALTDIGLYPLNTTRFVLDSEPVSVSATTASPDAAFADVDEHVAFQCVFENGVQAQCNASFDAYTGHQLRITGTEGRITLDPIFVEGNEQTVTLERDELTETVKLGEVDQLTPQFAYFAQCVLRDEEPIAGAAEGVRDMALVEAIYEAAEKEETVDVPVS
ncbi:D-xylose 1-dehydrogenase Gfo6 [Haloarchaeobius amylolyticus]|uniref:D-xylose 1-dehydrogenase Gfo6 n=1 Tax=Haloarchaeobius amylolyticus TaxID=1198296 RepID=UPI00226D41FF|nr:D-xylose 1-dehydrogenase Gfo6 [Haloarchaeobius amylolyticus]